jgi:acyl carrier protein
VNGYGATETPQIMCWFGVPAEFPSNGKQVPIGRGIDGVQILVLSKTGQLAGTGELGEIYIRTPYLTLGYENDETLTSARFLPHAFRTEARDRMYRTGDLGRYRPDGTVEFVRRDDDQVKIRGYRVELGEVESALAQHPLIRKAVVVRRDDGPAGPSLVGYLQTDQDDAVPPEALRSFLRERLPEYMVPSAWVTLDAFPLTPNGKIDRTALPRPDATRESLEVEFVAPRTPTEVAVAAIWQEVLQLDRVGVHDNFFDLGGHSLLATQVVARVKQSLRIDLGLRHLFEVPTLEELAGTVEILRHSAEAPESLGYDAGDDRSEFVL